MTRSHARLAAAGLSAALLLCLPATPAQASPYLSVSEAKSAVETTLLTQTLPAFGEQLTPYIETKCRKVSRSRATCSADFSTDRLAGSLRATVRETRDDYLVTFSRLAVKR